MFLGLFNPHAGPYLLKEELPLLLIGVSPLPGGHQDKNSCGSGISSMQDELRGNRTPGGD